VKIVVKARHMDATDAIRDYVESKVPKLVRYFDNIQTIEVILEVEADLPKVEIVVSASPRATFVASHRDADMYGCVDQCMDKIAQQLRKHKGRLRDHQHPAPDQQPAES